MKYFAPLLLLLILSFNVSAGTDGSAEKPFNIGIGSYASVIAYDNDLFKDDELSGISFSLGYAISDQFMLRGTLFSLEHDDNSALESTGFDLLGYFGTGLATHGFKAYIGGGLFRDTWELGGFEQTFDGLQLSGGLGYNWDVISLDFILGLRDASDYEDFVNQIPFVEVNAAAVSGSLLLSFRF